jgi:hypothetical protein
MRPWLMTLAPIYDQLLFRARTKFELLKKLAARRLTELAS